MIINIYLESEDNLVDKIDIQYNDKVTNIDDFKFEDFELENYQPHPAIKAEMAV